MGKEKILQEAKYSSNIILGISNNFYLGIQEYKRRNKKVFEKYKRFCYARVRLRRFFFAKIKIEQCD